MEPNHKLTGFLKGKGKLVLAFYQASRPSSSPVKYNGSKVVPSQSSSPASVGLYANRMFVFDHHPAEKKVSSYNTASDHLGKDYSSFGHGFCDESIDARAEGYISCVQERFKLERVD